MQRTFKEMIEAAGGSAGNPTTGDKAIKPGGFIIHEVGGGIMGAKSQERTRQKEKAVARENAKRNQA